MNIFRKDTSVDLYLNNRMREAEQKTGRMEKNAYILETIAVKHLSKYDPKAVTNFYAEVQQRKIAEENY